MSEEKEILLKNLLSELQKLPPDDVTAVKHIVTGMKIASKINKENRSERPNPVSK